MSRHAVLLLGALTLLSGAATRVNPLIPPSPQSQGFTFRTDVDLQSVAVRVQDAQGKDILGLTASDFTILEDGKPQKIAFFDPGKNPATIAVLVDSSGSVNSNGSLGSAQSIAAQFMKTARPGDEIYAMDFTDRVGPYQQLTHEQLLNPPTVPLAPTDRGGSALYDAVATALCHLRASKNLQQAIVIVSDGIDQHSRLSLDQLTALVSASRPQIFMIGLQSWPQFHFWGHDEPRFTLVTGHEIDNPAIVFRTLTKDSGGESSLPTNESGLARALADITDRLRAQYTLAYYRPDHSAKLRRVEVQVNRRGAHALYRQTIGSDASSPDGFHFDATACAVSPTDHPYPYEAKIASGRSGMIYREDFSDPRSGWPRHEISHYVSGGYELLSPLTITMRPSESGSTSFEYSGGQNAIAAYGPWWTSFRASVTMNAVLTPALGDATSNFPYAAFPAAGLVFRLNQDGYYALLVRGAGKKVLLAKLVKRLFTPDSNVDAETEVLRWTKITLPEASRAADIVVDALGDRISMRIDGHDLPTVRDDTFNQGLAGFIISGPGHATFSNWAVTEQKPDIQ